MKYRREDSFIADYARLSEQERELFRAAVRQMNEAYDQRGEQPLPRWPARLRVRDVEGARGVFEMTWSFAGPDGRATFEIITIDSEPAIKWRRIGDTRFLGTLKAVGADLRHAVGVRPQLRRMVWYELYQLRADKVSLKYGYSQ